MIPKKLRAKIAEDPFMEKCVVTGTTQTTGFMRVSWEHCWIYNGKQIQEAWAIVPLRLDLNVNMTQKVKDYCRWISLQRATEEDLAKYPKRDWKQLKQRFPGLDDALIDRIF